MMCVNLAYPSILKNLFRQKNF